MSACNNAETMLDDILNRFETLVTGRNCNRSFMNLVLVTGVNGMVLHKFVVTTIESIDNTKHSYLRGRDILTGETVEVSTDSNDYTLKLLTLGCGEAVSLLDTAICDYTNENL